MYARSNRIVTPRVHIKVLLLPHFLPSLMKEFEPEHDEIILVKVLPFGELLHQQWTKHRQLMLRHHFDQ
jgi:hypothetical protein